MVMGLENELSLATTDPYEPDVKRQCALNVVNGVKDIAVTVPNQEPATPGFMLANGSRIYLDIGNLIENATPEVLTPMAILVYQRAGELLLLTTLPNIAVSLKINPVKIKLVRASTDHSGFYRGIHINVLTRQFDVGYLVEYLTPFLVTRFYACSGGFGCSGFMMSQKYAAIKTIYSADSRENRGIINLKNEPLAKSPYKRIHVTLGDATMSELSTFLSVGATALVIRMLDDGASVGPAYQLHDPIKTLRQLDLDFSWSTPLPLASGLLASALEIQEHFLRAAEVYADRHDEFWMKQVVTYWRDVLETLKVKRPEGLSKKLDPYIKLRLYAAYLRQEKLTLEAFSCWCSPVKLAQPYLKEYPHEDIYGWLHAQMPYVDFHLLADSMSCNKFNWSDLPKIVALYDKMLVLDTMYHDISDQGIYYRLCNAGNLNSQMADISDITKAMHSPPQQTRAFARGNAILASAKEPGACGNWTQVCTSARQALFPDPFATVYSWQNKAQPQVK